MTKIAKAEKALKDLPQVDTPSEHFFTTGLYTRQTLLPEGTVAVGKRHRDRTLNVLIKGSMTVAMDDDPAHKVLLTAPCAFESEAGVKKAVYCHTECIILNVHRSEETDLRKLEEELIMPEDITGEDALGYALIEMEEDACHG